MIILFALLTVGSSLLMLYQKGVSRLITFFWAISLIPYPLEFGLKSHRIIIFFFFLSAILRWEDFKNEVLRFPYIKLLSVIFLLHLAVGIFDTRVGAATGLYRGFTFFLETFGVLLIGWISIKDRVGYGKFIDSIVKISIVICSYAFITIILRSDPISSAVGLSVNESPDFTVSQGVSRIRVGSLLFNSHVFGSVCCFYFLLVLPVLLHRGRLNKAYLIAIVFLGLGVLLSGSRTNLLCLIIGSGIIINNFYSISKKFKLVLPLLLILPVVLSVPAVSSQIEKISDVFESDGGKASGSNINMREQQLNLSLAFFAQKPLFGNGFYYFGEVLASDAELIAEDGLYGAESYIFMLLIENGVFYIIGVCLFFVILYRFFNINRLVSSRILISSGLSILVAFLSMSIMTGNTHKWEFFLPLLGFIMKTIFITRKTKKLHHENN